MKVRYSCTPCGTLRVYVEVPDREDTEDVVHWVGQTLAGRIGADHALRSPFCRATKMTEVLIPIAGSDAVGKPPRN